MSARRIYRGHTSGSRSRNLLVQQGGRRQPNAFLRSSPALLYIDAESCAFGLSYLIGLMFVVFLSRALFRGKGDVTWINKNVSGKHRIAFGNQRAHFLSEQVEPFGIIAYAINWDTAHLSDHVSHKSTAIEMQCVIASFAPDDGAGDIRSWRSHVIHDGIAPDGARREFKSPAHLRRWRLSIFSNEVQ